MPRNIEHPPIVRATKREGEKLAQVRRRVLRGRQSGTVMSRPLQQAHEWARRFDQGLSASSFDGSQVVAALDDGSHFLVRDAFYVKMDLADVNWVVVFSEHRGFFVFDSDEVERIEMSMPIPFKTKRSRRAS